MPVGLVCPACGTATTFQRVPVTACPNCQAPFPAPLRQSAEASLMQQKVTRPLLLTIGLHTAPVFGAMCLLGVTCAAFDVGTYTINDEVVSGPEFLRHAGPMTGSLGLVSLAIAFGIWRERPWTRWAIMAFWLVELAGGLGLGIAASGLAGGTAYLAQGAFFLLIAWWYCFDKDNVVEYYKALEAADAASAPR